jgi:hypothetical protein
VLARRLDNYVLLESGMPHQDLLYRLDPVGGEAPEQTEQVRSEERFILAVQGLASSRPAEPPVKRARSEAMGVGKGR